MRPYLDERRDNAIAYFVNAHFKARREYLFQTSLYKYIAFFEFEILKETGCPPLEYTYQALKKGPVPIEIYRNINSLKSELFKVKEILNKTDKKWFQFIPTTKKPDLDYFSEYEIQKLNDLIFIYSPFWVKTKIMSDASHEKILAWRKTWKENPNKIIDFKDEFGKNIEQKALNILTEPEEQYLNFQAIKRL